MNMRTVESKLTYGTPKVQHTPGPWRQGMKDGSYKHSVYPANGGDLIANAARLNPDCEANAALIASAPDLLAERDALKAQVAELSKRPFLTKEQEAVLWAAPNWKAQVAELREALAELHATFHNGYEVGSPRAVAALAASQAALAACGGEK